MTSAEREEIQRNLTVAQTLVGADLSQSATIHVGQAMLLLRRVLAREEKERKLDPAYDPEKISDEEVGDRHARQWKRVYGDENY